MQLTNCVRNKRKTAVMAGYASSTSIHSTTKIRKNELDLTVVLQVSTQPVKHHTITSVKKKSSISQFIYSSSRSSSDDSPHK